MPNEPAGAPVLPGALRDADTATGDETLPKGTVVPVRHRVPQCPSELAELIDALLAPGQRPTREQAVQVLARVFPAAPQQQDDDTDALIDELLALENQFAEPNLEDIRADARWIDAHWGGPELTRYRGEYVAVCNGSVVAHGPNELRVKRAAVEACRVHPQRVLLQYVPEPIL